MRYRSVCILFLLFFIACRHQDNGNDDSRLGSKIMILGHMGMGPGFSWPGNSKESILTCLEIGCDGSEMDVQLTLDSVLVACHSNDLSEQTNCSGKIHVSNWSDIAACRFNKNVNSSSVLRIEELFDVIPDIQDYYFSFDCKVNPGVGNLQQHYRKFLRSVKRLCSKNGIEEHVFLEGPKEFLLEAANMGMKNPLFLFSNNDDSPSDKAKAHNFFGISIPSDASSEDLNYAAQLKIRTMVWSPANYYQNKEVLTRKPDIIQSDDPITLLKLTNRYNYEVVRP